MTPERWERLHQLFGLASELPPDEVDAFLERECADDPELLREARELLEAAPPEKFVEPPLTPNPDESAPEGARRFFGLGLEGRTLDDFELVRLLGRGGMGVVYLATQTGLEREVAVKVLPAVRRLPMARMRFEREAKAASKLDHPRIVPVLAIGHAEGLDWYAMRYVEGHDLGRELAHAKEGDKLLPAFGSSDYVRTIVERIAELLDGIQHAHDSGIVHRDVKPQNILLDRDGRMNLTDFGLALDDRFETLSVTGEARGTPHYMSPEQVRARREKIDHRTDIYSLGIVLYELLAGRRPFLADTPMQVMQAIVELPASWLRSVNPSVPKSLEAICHKAIKKNAEDRYATASAFADDLRAFLQGRSPAARPPSLIERSAAIVRRHTRIAGAAAAAAFVFAVSGSTLMLTGPVAPRLIVQAAERASEVAAIELDGRTLARIPGGRRIDLGTSPTSSAVPVGWWLVVQYDGEDVVAESIHRLDEERVVTIPAPSGVPSERAHEMVVVEGGTIDLPEFGVVEIEPFEMDVYETTNAQYAEFLASIEDPEERASRRPWLWPDDVENRWDDEDASKPATGMTQLDVEAYLRWAGKRLPTYAEMRWAMHGAENRTYVWGDTYDEDKRVNCAVVEEFNPIFALRARGEAVDIADPEAWKKHLWPDYAARAWSDRRESDDVSWCGVRNLQGNVAEWALRPGADEGFSDTVGHFVTAGSSFGRRVEAGHTGSCNTQGGLGRDYQTGFRCVRSITP